ncbi:ATP-binding protein [Methylobacter psychrophilus]|uniref:ATP-binding protein n=1 Tax=Methylobacter psychrophilus TaxID=96941 RepID=UPI0021D49944|nr:ATP-binding protein [Methylobacter psychrophilus]
MSTDIARVDINFDQDVVATRQQARLIAEMLGFDRQDQARIATAVSEIASNTLQYGQGGVATFFIEGVESSEYFTISICDHGPGIEDLDAILEGRYMSSTGMGQGIVASKRLLPDHFHIDSKLGQGTTVTLGKWLPVTASPATLEGIKKALAELRAESPLEAIRSQNHELLAALELIRQRDEELRRVNQELIETNIGIVALYNELDDKTQRLQKTEQMLLKHNEELKGFAYTVAHDLKAPLRGITGYAQELAIKHKTGLSERALFCLSQIISANRNLDNLIEDLLNFVRMDTEAAPLFVEVDLGSLIKELLKDRNLIITELHVEVTVDIPLITLHTWECGLAQVLANLIDNAIKFSGKADPPRISIRAEDIKACYRIIVSDNGVGFDMKYSERIYGLFNRLVRTEEFEGTGAGLAIVKKILDKLGGSIRAEAQPGLGATFYVELPKSEIRNPKSEIRNPKSEIRNPKSEIRNKVLRNDFSTKEWFC